MSNTKTAVKKETAQEEATKTAQAAKVENATAKVKAILSPSADGRIKKLENFQLLANRYSFLKRKQDELERFILSSDGTKEKVILSNASGFSIEVSNTQVIEKVQELIQAELDTFVKASEKEIVNFQI